LFPNSKLGGFLETNATLREGRVLIEASINAVKELKPGASYSLTLALEMPLGVKNESELLSYLDKFHQAIAKFSEMDRAHVVVNMPMLHSGQEELIKTMKSKFETVMSLTESLKK